MLELETPRSATCSFPLELGSFYTILKLSTILQSLKGGYWAHPHTEAINQNPMKPFSMSCEIIFSKHYFMQKNDG